MNESKPEYARPAPAHLTNVDEAALLQRQHSLRRRLDAIDADARRGLDRDSSERAVELENADTLNEIARVTREELDSVERQLRRLQR